MSGRTALSAMEVLLGSVRSLAAGASAPSGCARVAPSRGAGATTNCSEARRLPALLGAVLRELRRAGNTSAAPPDPSAGTDGSLYILLIVIFYGCLAGALMLAYTRSRKLEPKHDPYHLYTEREWGPGGPAQAAEEGGPAEGQRP